MDRAVFDRVHSPTHCAATEFRWLTVLAGGGTCRSMLHHAGNLWGMTSQLGNSCHRLVALGYNHGANAVDVGLIQGVAGGDVSLVLLSNQVGPLLRITLCSHSLVLHV